MAVYIENDGIDLGRNFMQENQHTRKLRETIEGYWEILKMSQNCTMAVQECDVIKKENQKAEYEKYLKLRVRPLMEYFLNTNCASVPSNDNPRRIIALSPI